MKYRDVLFMAMMMSSPLTISAVESQVPHMSISAMTMSFGVEAGDPTQEIGAIKDAARDEKGAIFVLDGSMNRIMVVAEAGSLITTAGRSGNGPGEFRMPVAIGYDSLERMLFVLDPTAGRISRFTWNGRDLQFHSAMPAPSFAYDLCLMKGNVVLYIPGDSKREVVQILDTDGRVVKSFGTPFSSSGGPGVQMMNRNGSVVCDASTGNVMLTGGAGEVRLYSGSGGLTWQGQLTGFRQVPIIPTAGGARIDWDNMTPPTDIIDNAFLIPGGHTVAVQSVRSDLTRKPEERNPRRMTFYVDLHQGRTLAIQEDLPRISAVFGDRVMVTDDDPFPRLRLLRVTQGR